MSIRNPFNSSTTVDERLRDLRKFTLTQCVDALCYAPSLQPSTTAALVKRMRSLSAQLPQKMVQITLTENDEGVVECDFQFKPNGSILTDNTAKTGTPLGYAFITIKNALEEAGQ